MDCGTIIGTEELNPSAFVFPEEQGLFDRIGEFTQVTKGQAIRSAQLLLEALQGSDDEDHTFLSM